MKTYQLKFIAWTFSAFLPPDDPDAQQETDYYELLDIPKNANADAIKKAYRKRSLQLHPDKLRQRGMKYNGEIITEEEARSRFQQMKAAYDTLKDPKKRQIYDALGHRGMQFVNNPSSAMDPQILLGNLAKSSVFDRAKLMTLVLLFFGLVLLQPILICAKVDQILEKNGGALENASWVALVVPFWLFAAFYGVLLIIGKAVFPLMQWISFVVGVLFLTLKWDEVLSWDYAVLFIPFYMWMVLRMYEAKNEMNKVRADMSKMTTIEFIEKFVINEVKQDDNGIDIEDQLHRTYNDLNEEERDEINKDYIIVHVPPKAAAPGDNEDEEDDDFDLIARSPEYQEARSRYDHASKSMQRIIIPELPLIVLIIVQLDMNKSWNWGITFLPLWIAMALECCGGCYGFFCTSALAHIEVQEAMADHIAKEQEAQGAKKEGDEPPVDETPVAVARIVTLEGSHDHQAVATKWEEGSTANTDIDRAAETRISEKSAQEGQTKLGTGVSVEPLLKIDETKDNAESEVNGAKSEEKEAGDEDEDDDFMFEMDEDTFNFYQQAEVEAENIATEAQSKAISSFCNIIFQTIIAALFVAKLNRVYEERDEELMDGTSTFSSFWVLFPFLLISGCVISCFGCAIFGAANIDTAMSSETAGENGDSNAGSEEAADTSNNEATPVILTPPSQGVEEPKQKEEAEYYGQTVTESSNHVESAENGTKPQEEKTDMDDLD